MVGITIYIYIGTSKYNIYINGQRGSYFNTISIHIIGIRRIINITYIKASTKIKLNNKKQYHL